MRTLQASSEVAASSTAQSASVSRFTRSVAVVTPCMQARLANERIPSSVIGASKPALPILRSARNTYPEVKIDDLSTGKMSKPVINLTDADVVKTLEVLQK